MIGILNKKQNNSKLNKEGAEKIYNLQRQSYFSRFQSLNDIRDNRNSVMEGVFGKDKKYQTIPYEFNQRKISCHFSSPIFVV